MKKYTLEMLLEDKIKFPVGGQKLTPKPFPGKFPTHVAMRIVYSNDHVWTYFGKPTRGYGLEFRRALSNPRVRILGAWEFDRKYLIASWVVENPAYRIASQAPTSYSTTLRYYYHPFKVGLEHFIAPFWVKRIKAGKRIHSVYSEMEKLSIADHIGPFKKWVEGMGIE